VRSSSKSSVLVALTLAAVLVTMALCAAASAAARLRDPGLSVSVAPATLRYGETVRLQVHLSVPAASLQVSRSYAGDPAFTPLLTLVADDSGDASWTDTPLHSCGYKVEYAGDTTWAAATGEATVPVRAKVSLSITAASRVRTGDRVTLDVAVVPGAAAAPVELQDWDEADGSWRTLASVMPDAQAQARWVWRPQSLGRHRLRAVLAASAASPSSVSGVRSVRVYDANDPYGVPASYPHLILVDLSQYKLYYYEHGRLVRTFGCVLGRPSLPTPRGHFKIYAKDPHMYGPYGPRRMRYLGLYAIHGTNEPWLLSLWPRNYSHGCTRLANANILWLYDRVHVGTPVWNVP
jgi:hypothetical protein